MNKNASRVMTIFLGTLLFLQTTTVPAQDPPRIRNQAEARALERGVYIEWAKVNVVEVDVIEAGGAHLKVGQKIMIIGPFWDGRYALRPVLDPESPTHVWMDKNHPANKTGPKTGKFYQVEVGIKAGLHDAGDDTHQILMNILESDDDGPKVVEFWGTNHSPSDVDHGGTAHARR